MTTAEPRVSTNAERDAEIAAAYSAGGVSFLDLAQEHGLCQSRIGQIIRDTPLPDGSSAKPARIARKAAANGDTAAPAPKAATKTEKAASAVTTRPKTAKAKAKKAVKKAKRK